MHKLICYLALTLAAGRLLHAQVPVEIFAGHQQIQHDFFFFKNIDSARKFNLFSIARFVVDYNDRNANTSFINSLFTYNFKKNIGLSSGIVYEEKLFNVVVALSYLYTNKKGDFFMNLFPAVRFGEKRTYELFGIAIFRPRISEKWSLFNQFIFSTAVNDRFSRHVFSNQQFRLGFGFKNKFQSGLGFDHNLYGNGTGNRYTHNMGLFIRREL